jgi:sulfur-oxidizing protein SoxB
VFAQLLPPDPAMAELINKQRAPFLQQLEAPLAVSEGLLYRRGNFNGSFDQLILDALMHVEGADIAFSPGFRWGGCLLPGETLTMERLLDHTAITYPAVIVNTLTGERIKAVLEDAADNLFNPDPYYQQGGDMVRVGGLEYTITPGARAGARISDMRLHGRPLEAGKTYKVAGWAPVAQEAALAGNKPVWEHVEAWLRARPGGRVTPRQVNTPRIVGMQGNPGMA